MSRPSAQDVLATIETTLDDIVRPAVSGVEALSALATIGHLLRHVRLRLSFEADILSSEISLLTPLVNDIADWLEGVGAGSLAIPQDRPTSIGVDALAASTFAWRTAIDEGLEMLQAARATHGDDPAYRALRQRIRDYIATQIIEEARLIDPAFAGKGPRR